MWIHAFFAALAAAPPAVPTPPALAATLAEHVRVQSSGDDYQTLRARYVEALRVWKQAGDAGHGDTPHPIRAYWPRFEALGAGGDVLALGWLLENLGRAFDDPAQTRKQGLWVLQRLFDTKPSVEAESALLAKLNQQIGVLDEDTLLDLCQAVVGKSDSPETRAQALWLFAWARSEKGTTQDPLRRAEADEIHNTILMEYPNTDAGRRAAYATIPITNERFQDANWAWVESVRELQAAGRPPSDWPPLPIERFRPFYVPLARAKHPQAMMWLESLYPAFERAHRQGDIGPGINAVIEAIGLVYPPRGREAANLRLAMLSVLYAQFPSDAWIVLSLQSLSSIAGILPLETTEQTVAILIEKSSDAEIRALALSVLADVLTVSGNIESDLRAAALYQRVLDEYPTTSVTLSVRSKRDTLARILPGGLPPETTEVDAEGKELHFSEYKGRVVLVEFYRLRDDDYLQAAPLRGALAKSMAGRSFELIGVRVGLGTQPRIDKFRASHGVPLHTLIIPRSEHEILKIWLVRKYPTTCVIDAEGILRARDLPWEETAALVERLVADAERKRPQK